MKVIKILGVSFLILLVLCGIGVYWGSNWVNQNLESIINSKPDRKYNFSFEKFDFDLLQRVILISDVHISPVGEQEGVFVQGHVSQVLLNKLNLRKLYLNREVDIKELKFSKPEFIIHIPLENPTKERAGQALQGFFGDILSRGGIENFELGNASARIVLGEEQIGTLSNFNIIATELRTDSLKWNYPIPFDYGRIFISIDSMDYKMANNQQFKVEKIGFDTRTQQLKLESISLKYPEGLRKVSTQMEFQTDLIDLELDSMIFSGLEANSNLYSDLDIRARKLEISGLVLEDFRNKNLPRPKDEIKPLFQGLVNKISFPLKLDTLQVTNGTIIYGESVPGTNDFWKLSFDHLNGELVNITTIPEYQAKYLHFDGKFTGKIENNGILDFTLQVPYDKDEFDMDVNFSDFRLTKLNEILNPIMNGEILTGDLDKMNLKIHGDSIKSTNKFRFDYTDLKIELYQKNSQKKNRIMSTIANIALNSSNLPGEKRYMTAEYTTQRNRYRGPFHLFWKSTKEGIMQIVPGGAAKEILNTSEK
ncbi:MAG TPA: DUF748 domain-containing protein [Algoriphagus sp.]|nr:DUF748 domain-containing protein [Algoriphagus sp.]